MRVTAVQEEGPKNSVKKGAHLGPSNEGECARDTRHARRAREVGVLKQHDVGEGEGEHPFTF